MSQSSGISSQSGIKGLNYSHDTGPVTKRTDVGAGAVGGGQDPALVAWFEQANSYYNAVMAGDPSTPKPTEAEWNDFMSQLQWAQQQLGYGGGGAGGSLGMVGGGYGQPQGPQSNQFGGMSGTMDNWVYTNAEAEIGFTGNGTHDIWSNDVTINVAPVSGHVTIEQTTDTRFQPNEQVTKVVVTDPATGTEAVYFLHDFDPTKDKLNIKTPEEGQVTNNSGFPDGVYSWGEFKAGGASDPNAKPDASIEGIEQADGSLRYEPDFAGETVNFWANPSGAGDTQTHVIYADANISVKPSDEVYVEMQGDVAVVTVKHSDGSSDVYNVQKGYNVNINQKTDYIHEGAPPADGSPPTTSIGEDGFSSADLKDRITVNGAAGGAEGGTGTVDADAMVSGLLDASERSEAQLLSALQSSGFDYDSIEEFKTAITSGEFPGEPTTALFNFLRTLDEDVNGAMDDLAEAMAGTDDTKKKNETEDAQDALLDILKLLYPNDIVDGEAISTGGSGSISINGTNYTWGTSSGEFSNVTGG